MCRDSFGNLVIGHFSAEFQFEFLLCLRQTRVGFLRLELNNDPVLKEFEILLDGRMYSGRECRESANKSQSQT